VGCGRPPASCPPPNGLVKPLHDRKPVILAPADFGLWLDPKVEKGTELQALFRPYPAEAMAGLREDKLARALNDKDQAAARKYEQAQVKAQQGAAEAEGCSRRPSACGRRSCRRRLPQTTARTPSPTSPPRTSCSATCNSASASAPGRRRA
jgi:hypothetical protein